MRVALRCFLVAVLLLASDASKGQDPYPSVYKLTALLREAQTDSARAATLIQLSNTYLEFNLLDSSLWAANQAKALAAKAELPLVECWADFLIGAFYFYEGSYDEGIRLEQAVIANAETLRAPLLKANAQKLIGWMYTEMGRETEALALFMEAMPVFKQNRFTDLQMNVGIGYYGIATTYFYLNKFDLALLYYDSAIGAEPSMDSRELALALADRAAVKLDYLQNAEAALSDALKANRLLENHPLQIDAQAYVQAELARVYSRMKNFEQAEKWAQTAYRGYSQIPLVKRYASVYRTLSEAFQLSGNYEMAFQVEYEIRMLNDSIYQWRKLQVIEDLKTKYETDKKNAQITQLELDNLNQSNIIIKNRTATFILAMFILLLVGMALVFYRKREKYHAKINRLEAEQKVREERDRIARELHDSLGGQLSSISIGVGRLQHTADAEKVEAVQTMADRALHELRDSLWVLSKETVSVEEMEQRVNTLFLQYRKIETPLQFDAQFSPGLNGLKLTAVTAGHVYRIIQEAASNAVKHSKASRFIVRLFQQQAFAVLQMEDDGQGFDCNTKQIEEHFGLHNMKKRAEALQATLTVRSSAGVGTVVEVVFPIGSLQ
jgi:signal transduction histidine kinase